MSDLSVPIRVKIDLEARLALSQKEAREWASRARLAEEKVERFRRDARATLEQMAQRLTTATQREEAALTLKALARRLELEGELAR